MHKTDNKEGVFQKPVECKNIPLEECMKISSCIDCAASPDVTKIRKKRSEENNGNRKRGAEDCRCCN